MAFFADTMQAFTADLGSCTSQRKAALSALHDHTQTLLAEARSFVQRLGDEHQAVATNIRRTLSEEQQSRTERVQSLRQEFRDRFHELRDALHAHLNDCRDNRRAHLDDMFHGFRQARQNLANDLRKAASHWRKHVGR